MAALEYLDYSVGNYGPSKRGGVALQFRNLIDGSERYSIFNAETRRNRNTKHGKKGGPLPRRQFRITERFKFYGFWVSTGLPVPRRLSAFHDYMGKLASLVFTCSTASGERLHDPSPLSLSHIDLVRLVGVNAASDISAPRRAGTTIVKGADTLPIEVRAGELPDSCLTVTGQIPDNCRTSAPDKETAQSQQPPEIQPDGSTGRQKNGNTVTREHGYTGTMSPSPTTPEEQTNEQWLADYVGAD
ncbi:hypothetical protein [Microbulbifer sp. YPW16]|uniref:hypothetical protein n=1 Tax=Microbulbifer sp. YPW16 TaxID=2904242 RepID=UPI001E28A16D|nr:hypothetical protein [Microbulbifer sp. YPW16]UHQ56641.1 hypothetical protein LVE68_06645 [Microbulbifer sp. YPW16]